jgi:hypothetical protein
MHTKEVKNNRVILIKALKALFASEGEGRRGLWREGIRGKIEKYFTFLKEFI